MSFQPVLPLTGYAGWRFLQQTIDRQTSIFAESPPIKRVTEDFRNRIGAVQSADDLIKDRRLLTVALGAFGLDDDIGNTFFIRKILEEGTDDPGSFANRLADKRYVAFADAFGLSGSKKVFAPSEPPSDIAARFIQDRERRGADLPPALRSDAPAEEKTAWEVRKTAVEAAYAAETDRLATGFIARIGETASLDALLADRELLTVALGAAGLPADSAGFFLVRNLAREVAADAGSLPTGSLYASFFQTFVGEAERPSAARPGFTEEIVSRFQTRQFERAVGEQSETMRFALNLGPGLSELLTLNKTERGQWFALMGDPPLRKVLEGALGLPQAFGSIDLDLQLEGFRNRAMSTFGTDRLADLALPENREKLIRLYMLRADATETGLSSTAAALSLLQAR